MGIAGPLVFLGVLFVGLVAAPVASAQDLPDQFGNWAATGPAMQLAAGATGTSPDVLKEYGLQSITQRIYSPSSSAKGLQKSEKLEVTTYRVKDPSGAYGLYSYLRENDMRRVNITEHASISPKRALILEGDNVLDVAGKNLTQLTEDFKYLASAMVPKSDVGPYPVLYGHLPQSGLILGSDRYVLGPIALHQFFPVAGGDWLGFSSDGAEAEVAKYRSPEGEITILLADFPTPQAAQKKLRAFGQIFDLNPTGAGAKPVPASAANSADATGGAQGKTVLFAARSMSLVALAMDAKSLKQAEAVLGQVHAGTELTWNEPSFTFTQPNIGVIVVGIIYGTGILCLFAFIAGLAFGGVRLAVKRLLPGKIFDSTNQLQVLQLGLASKPINSQDFYGVGGSKSNPTSGS
jgi:hypothetical protein